MNPLSLPTTAVEVLTSRSDHAAAREVICGDALQWLARADCLANHHIITSLPDYMELHHLGFEQWQQWFEAAAYAILSRLGTQGVAVFYQSDIKHQNAWVDKSYLVMQAGSRAKVPLSWHKIVCRKQAGTATPGRASYTHMLCFSHRTDFHPMWATPDVLVDAGAMLWPKAMGLLACEDACRFARRMAPELPIVDPFCGYGTVLAVANLLGSAAIGVDLSKRKCRKAVRLVVDDCAAASFRFTRDAFCDFEMLAVDGGSDV